MNRTSPLYVDLDGTFIKSDMLFESLLIVIKRNPFMVFMCIIWLVQGKSYLKYKLSEQADIAVELLPINPEFIAFLLDEKEKNREIVLATASSKKYAESICSKFNLFDSYISSDMDKNLKGAAKLSKIKSLSDKYSYAGNSSEDFILFEQSEESYLVNPTKRIKRIALKYAPTRIFDNETGGVNVWLKQLRVYQWLKNLLIFVPLLVSGSFVTSNNIFLSLIGFFSFSCLASATYIINDLLDLDADRSHERKKNRPLAAGTISIGKALIVAAILFNIAFSIALISDGSFIFLLVAYLILTLMYSFKLKQYIGLDVIVLAGLYTIRIFAGAVILDVIVSFWLLSFSMFIFFSLALIKRCAELKSFEGTRRDQAKGRDYSMTDFPLLMSTGTSSALLSVLMFSFYVNNNVLTNQYQKPDLLWLIIPAMCYWMMRMWIKTNRGEMHDDPIVFSLKDKGGRITIIFIVFIALLAQIL
jgi:4-hydroxybenzoate polyprenyltransferase